MRQVIVDACDKNNRAKQFKVATTILNALITGEQIGVSYERRWFTKRLELTCWRTTYFAPSWPLPPTKTTSPLAR